MSTFELIPEIEVDAGTDWASCQWTTPEQAEFFSVFVRGSDNFAKIIDDFNTYDEAVEHLRSLGCTQFAYFNGTRFEEVAVEA